MKRMLSVVFVLITLTACRERPPINEVEARLFRGMPVGELVDLIGEPAQKSNGTRHLPEGAVAIQYFEYFNLVTDDGYYLRIVVGRDEKIADWTWKKNSTAVASSIPKSVFRNACRPIFYTEFFDGAKQWRKSNICANSLDKVSFQL